MLVQLEPVTQFVLVKCMKESQGVMFFFGVVVLLLLFFPPVVSRDFLHCVETLCVRACVRVCVRVCVDNVSFM